MAIQVTSCMNNDLKVLHLNHVIIVHSGNVTFLSVSFVMCSQVVIRNLV